MPIAVHGATERFHALPKTGQGKDLADLPVGGARRSEHPDHGICPDGRAAVDEDEDRPRRNVGLADAKRVQVLALVSAEVDRRAHASRHVVRSVLAHATVAVKEEYRTFTSGHSGYHTPGGMLWGRRIGPVGPTTLGHERGPMMATRKRRAEQERAAQVRRRTNAIVALVAAIAIISGLLLVSQRIGAAPSADASVAGLRPCPSAPVDAQPYGDLPDQEFECLGEGPALNLASLAGKPAILNVWASWCPPCVEELPWLGALDDRAKGSISFIGIDVNDDRASALAMLAASGVHYPSVFDRSSASRATLHWAGTPITVFIDANGNIVHRVDGRLPDMTTLEVLIQQHLGVTLPPA